MEQSREQRIERGHRGENQTHFTGRHVCGGNADDIVAVHRVAFSRGDAQREIEEEAARTLKRGGAKRVTVAVLARAEGK